MNSEITDAYLVSKENNLKKLKDEADKMSIEKKNKVNS
jgi:hypothetical protein